LTRVENSWVVIIVVVVGSEKIDLGENIILYKIEKKCERTERKQLLNAYESRTAREPAYKGGPPPEERWETETETEIVSPAEGKSERVRERNAWERHSP